MTNTLTAALAKAPKPQKGPPCSIGVVLGTIPETDAPGWDAEIRRGAFTDRQIATALNELCGSDVKFYSVGHHRKGDCQCEPLATKEA